MERITIIVRTTKKEGTIKLRFRLVDGRQVDLYHKSDIQADIKDLSKFNADGTLKPKVSIYNRDLLEMITNEINVMRKAYSVMQTDHLPLIGETFEQIIHNLNNPEEENEKQDSLLTQLSDFIETSFRDRIIGEGRLKHYNVTQRELERFLIINHIPDITPKDFTAELLMEYRLFLINEYTYVEEWRGLYTGIKENNLPKQPRNPNTVAGKLNQLAAFFTSLEDREIIPKSPFRKLGKNRKSTALKEEYDDPVYLTAEEFTKVRNTNVPKTLQETKDAFILQCSLGCRISDFKTMSMDNIAISDEGFAYVRYLPQKTKTVTRDEVETPLMRFALEIIKEYNFKFHILTYVSGEKGYNQKIKRLLEYCEINRECKTFSLESNDNIYRPLYEFGSSKLCRKTFVDMMNKVQIDLYAAGLHKAGSSAVTRYTHMTLKDRFTLMCAAFGEQAYTTDNQLNTKE